jgi:hypothetical protein
LLLLLLLLLLLQFVEASAHQPLHQLLCQPQSAFCSCLLD